MRERGTYEFRALHYSTASLHNNYGGDFSIAEGELRGRGGGREHEQKYTRPTIPERREDLEACSFVCNSIFQPDLDSSPPPSFLPFPYKEIVVKG